MLRISRRIERWAALGFACFGWLQSTASGATVAVAPPVQTTPLGAPVEVAIEISGLGAFAAPSLGAFDIDLAFDPAVLGLTGVTFGDPGLGDQLDLFGFGSIFADTLGVGTVNLFEVSLDLPFDLDTLQADAFALAVVSFDAVGAGVSPLSLTINALGDSEGFPLEASTLDGSVTVRPAAGVPEPANWLLIVGGLGALAATRSRRKSRSADRTAHDRAGR